MTDHRDVSHGEELRMLPWSSMDTDPAGHSRWGIAIAAILVLGILLLTWFASR